MTEDTQRASRNYGVAQSTLLFVFAGAYFLDSGPGLVAPGGSAGVIGAALCAVGLLLMLAAFVSLGGAIRIAPEPKPGAGLVTRGVYRYLRHPIYTGIVLVVVGLLLRKPSLLVGIAAVVVVAFLALKTRFEERLLLARYPEYAEYRRRTWGIL